jgi:hypothetical protein
LPEYHNWNDRICSFLRLASFTYWGAFKIHLCLSVAWQLISLNCRVRFHYGCSMNDLTMHILKDFLVAFSFWWLWINICV